ncbi:Periplasmic serine endoprotease DegP [Streptomyces hundungensis]|uniref:Periplasmic serine endoprotease DegP n=1 Tax=Streptomyces hundungensis TaxID=1077946 RepID=A0A387HDL6_9ACTN|nr:trypsin-like peptidase domain-containing protein [Streptomyces hundungensis]AYG81514.1 Periplasmic serine endoprotease DegP [Streptomyces hundungensis]
MTESPRHSGEYPEQQPTHSDESWQRAKDDARREAEAYAAAYPPPPPYQPATAMPATAGEPGAPRPRRAKRSVGLIAAVAIVAAAMGGGTASLVEHYVGNDRASVSSGVSGTNASNSTNGTVSGVAKAVMPSIVEINATSGSGESTGAGVIITAGGEIITNNHVISGATSVKVKLSDGKSYTAKVVGTDPDKDLALIKLNGASGLKPASLGDSSKIAVGDQVVAIGSPEGLTGTVTSGIVSALDRDVTVAKEQGNQGQGQGQGRGQGGWPFEFGGQQFNGDTGSSKTTYKALQTDASLNPGNSGGALIDMNGNIIGINSAMYSPSSSSQSGSSAGSVGLGFAIPINTVKSDLASLRGGGSGGDTGGSTNQGGDSSGGPFSGSY